MAALPQLSIEPLQPAGNGTVQGILLSDGGYAGTQVTFSFLEITATGTAIVDDSGQAVSPPLALGGNGTYTLQATVGSTVLALLQFNTT